VCKVDLGTQMDMLRQPGDERKDGGALIDQEDTNEPPLPPTPSFPDLR